MKPNIDGLLVTLKGVRHDLALLARDHDHLFKSAVNKCDELLIDLEATREYRDEQAIEILPIDVWCDTCGDEFTIDALTHGGWAICLQGHRTQIYKDR